MKPENPRDHGLGDFHLLFKIVGKPSIVSNVDSECPNCKCWPTYEVNIKVESGLLKGGKGTAHYVGCAACPWASPSTAVADAT